VLMYVSTLDNFNIDLVKNNHMLHKEHVTILEKLTFMDTFEEISEWVLAHSHNQKYIANPSNAGDADRLDCLFGIQEPLALALKPLEKRRKNGRDARLIEATKLGDYTLISDILASAAATYWRDHGYFNNEKNLKIASFLKNDEKNQQKKEFQKAQLDHIGAAVEFTKARKKGAFQERLDFVETEEILKINNFED